MKNINDDLLNRFIDKELSNDENKIVRDAIENSPDIKKRYEFLLKVHLLLKDIKPESPSMEFSKLVMNKIYKHSIIESQQKRFMLIVLSFLGIIILGIVGYIFSQTINTIQLNSSNETITTYSNTIGDYFSALFGKKNLSIFGSVLSFIMLVSGYFLYDYQKHSKKKFSH